MTDPTTPTFSIVDNGDGTATVYDGSLAVVTIERERGTANAPGSTTYLKYVAQGVQYECPDLGDRYDRPTVHVSCAARSTETETVSKAAWSPLAAEARRLYVAGYVSEAKRHVADPTYDDWTPERLAEMASKPEFVEHSGRDLADALLAEFGS